jgi:hypothetical protein
MTRLSIMHPQHSGFSAFADVAALPRAYLGHDNAFLIKR